MQGKYVKEQVAVAGVVVVVVAVGAVVEGSHS
jgi:hypothetical protein